VGDTNRTAGALVGLIGPAGEVGLDKSVDDAVFAGCADVVDCPGQGRSAATRSIGSSVPSSSSNAFLDAA
jgi:hypothetical protein